jgi:hypothetical protein
MGNVYDQGKSSGPPPVRERPSLPLGCGRSRLTGPDERKNVKDWKQEIVQTIQERCDHGPDSEIVGPGCSRCQDLFMKIVVIMDSALDQLAEEIGDYASNSTPDVVRRFKRSIRER